MASTIWFKSIIELTNVFEYFLPNHGLSHSGFMGYVTYLSLKTLN